MGLPDVFTDKQEDVEIKDYRGCLPCDLVSIIAVRNEQTQTSLRYMTDAFNGKSDAWRSFDSYKVQGRVIYTSFKEGKVCVSYQAIKVDDEGLPLLPDAPVFLRALEAYIKKEKFTILFEVNMGKSKVSQQMLQHAEQDYAFKVGQLNAAFTVPSYDEMQSLTGMLHQLLPRFNEHIKGWKTLGDKEYIKVQ